MSNLRNDYLRRTGRYLQALPAEIRENELLEISGHLEMLAEDLRVEGIEEKMATQVAIQRFGSAAVVGKRVRDVWEGNLGWLSVVAMVIASNWLWDIAYWAIGIHLVMNYPLNDERLLTPLQPLIVLWAVTTSWVIPFAWNFILGRWGGRRVCFVAPLAYLPWLVACLVLRVINPDLSSYSAAIAPAILAALGAWAGSATMRKKRMALVTGVSPQQASSVLPQLKPSKALLKSSLLGVLTLGLAWTGAFVWAAPRVKETLHPSTPTSAVRVLLSSPTRNTGQMEASTDVVLRELPPRSPAEAAKADQEKRVAYSATMHATSSYREKRIAFYQKILRQEPGQPIAKFAAQGLQRLRPQGYRVSGVLKVVRTKEGWEIDTSGGPENQPWQWLYDLYYQEAK